MCLLSLALLYISIFISSDAYTASAFSNLSFLSASKRTDVNYAVAANGSFKRIRTRRVESLQSIPSERITTYNNFRTRRSLYSVSNDRRSDDDRDMEVEVEVRDADDIDLPHFVVNANSNSKRRASTSTLVADDSSARPSMVDTSTNTKTVSVSPAPTNENSIGNNNVENNAVAGSFNLPYSRPVRNFLAQPVVEIIFSLLVLLSTFLVALETLDLESMEGIPQFLVDSLGNIEDVIAGIFTIEFFARWYGFGQLTGRYLRNFLVIIDLLVVVLPFGLSMAPALAMMLPPILSSPSGLITLRLLRIVRLQRVLVDMETFGQIEIALGRKKSEVKAYQLQVARVILSVFTLLTVASGLIYTAEHEYNPDIPDYFTALYFGLTTLTTVGFGDITPGE